MDGAAMGEIEITYDFRLCGRAVLGGTPRLRQIADFRHARAWPACLAVCPPMLEFDIFPRARHDMYRRSALSLSPTLFCDA